MESQDRSVGPERIHALADGVVAIALTVLALEIRVPEAEGGTMRHTLQAMLPQALAFGLSFVVIAGFWLAHHRLTRAVRQTSRAYHLANLGLMLALVALNAPTVLLARHADHEPLAVALYAGVVAIAALMLISVATCVRIQRLAGEASRPVDFATVWPALVFLASIPTALLGHPFAAMLSWTGVAASPAWRWWREFRRHVPRVAIPQARVAFPHRPFLRRCQHRPPSTPRRQMEAR